MITGDRDSSSANKLERGMAESSVVGLLCWGKWALETKAWSFLQTPSSYWPGQRTLRTSSRAGDFAGLCSPGPGRRPALPHHLPITGCGWAWGKLSWGSEVWVFDPPCQSSRPHSKDDLQYLLAHHRALGSSPSSLSLAQHPLPTLKLLFSDCWPLSLSSRVLRGISGAWRGWEEILEMASPSSPQIRAASSLGQDK